MSATLAPPMPANTAGIHVRPGLGRLVGVELRKMVDTRAGFWLQVAIVVLTAVVVIARRIFGDGTDHTFAGVLTTLLVCSGIVAAGVLVASPGVEGTWSDAATLVGQSAVYLGGGMVVGVAFGAILLASAPAIVALFALPSAWLAVTSLSIFGDAGPWLDTGRGLGPLSREVVNGTQWAQAGTSLALWMLLPLLIGIWRINRREVAA